MKGRMKYPSFFLLFLVVILALLLVSCGEAYLNNIDPNVSSVQARATLEYVHAVQTSTAQAQYAEQWRVTVQAASTQDALNTAYLAAQSTAEIIRAEAGATQTAQVWNATASANATAASWSSTATQAVWNIQATSDTSSLQALQTAQAAQAEMAQLAAERQRTVNTVQAAAPWIVLAIAVPLVAYLAWLWGKTEALRRRAIPARFSRRRADPDPGRSRAAKHHRSRSVLWSSHDHYPIRKAGSAATGSARSSIASKSARSGR